MSSGYCLQQSLSQPEWIAMTRKTWYSNEVWPLSTTRTRGHGQEVILQRYSGHIYKIGPIYMDLFLVTNLLIIFIMVPIMYRIS